MTFYHRGRSAAVVSALAAAVLAASPAAAAENQCAPTVEAKLTELGIDRAGVATIGYGPRTRQEGRGEKVFAIDAWISFSSCQGSLVIQMRPNCVFRDLYTRDGCSLDQLTTR